MHFKLRNRLHTVDSIAGATIAFTQQGGSDVLLSGTTNAHGDATLNLSVLPSGTYSCSISAAQVSADPVGPSLASTGAPVDRIYRPVTLTVVRIAEGISSAIPTNAQHAWVSLSTTKMTVDIQPVWMRSSANSSRGKAVSMIVVHHTACNVAIAVNTFLAEKGPHYMIDTDGQIVKWVHDTRAAWHAGEARWFGDPNINQRSIGIEIVHSSGAYPSAQYTALLDLLKRIRTSTPTIGVWNVVGHSDVATNTTGRLGRKSGDPGPEFEWARLENIGLGLSRIEGPADPNIYAGFFQAFPTQSLQRGDNDARHRLGGAVQKAFTGEPVKALQEDLALIGYSVGNADGDFGEKVHHAVIAFQEHFFAGGRGHKNPDGRVDVQTAGIIGSVASAAAVTVGP